MGGGVEADMPGLHFERPVLLQLPVAVADVAIVAYELPDLAAGDQDHP